MGHKITYDENIILETGMDCSNQEYYKIKLPPRAQDLTKEIFGNLTALFPVRLQKNKRLYWLCLCSCGKIKAILPANLVTNKIKSCGCLRSKTTSKHITKLNQTKKINLIDQTFGFLEVIEEDREKTFEKSYNGKYTRYYWKCKCHICNNIESVRTDLLVEGLKICCSNCAKYSSQGETEIFELLTSNHIPFIRQKTFSSCRLPSGWLAKFDFWINETVLVEFDGIQHFEETKNPNFNYEKIQESDLIKNKWCLENKIPLIRIPYFKLGKITLQDLDPKTTFFLVKGGDE